MVKTIFVAGIHGVGKTTLCAEVAAHFELNCLTASDVIRRAKASAISLRGKEVANLNENQQLLVSGIQSQVRAGTLLLDGHLTLRTPHGVEAIPANVFRDIGTAAILTIVDNPREIRKRLFDRDSVAPNLEDIRAHQAAEIAHAQVLSAELRVPSITLERPTSEELKAEIGSLVN